jgi:hypothetical protein
MPEKKQNYHKLSLLIGLVFLLFGYYYKIKTPDATNLTTIEIIVNETPSIFHHKGSRGYEIKTQNVNCRFEISGGAYQIVDQSPELKNKIENLKNGDTLTVKVESNELDKMKGPRCRIPIVGLSKSGLQIIKVVDTLRNQAENLQQFIIFGWVLTLVGVIVWIIKANYSSN